MLLVIAAVCACGLIAERLRAPDKVALRNAFSRDVRTSRGHR
jgi:hypothetical protein